MKRKLLSVGLFISTVLLVSVLIAPSASGLRLNAEKVIVYAMPYEFDEYSDLTAMSYATAQWVSAVQVGLYGRSTAADRDFVPVLASALPTISTNSTQFTVKIKDGLKFSNDEVLNADDVVFSFKVHTTPAIDMNNYATASQYLTNSSVTKIDDLTVMFNFTKTFAFFYTVLYMAILPQDYFQARYDTCMAGTITMCVWDADDGSDAIGAGPYKVDSIDNTNEVVTLVKNDNYYNAENVAVDKLIFQYILEKASAVSELAAGKIDIFDAQYVAAKEELTDVDDIVEEYVGDPGHQEISLNHKNPYWGTGLMTPAGIASAADADAAALNVRKAMSHIVDRNNFVNEILEGLAQPASTVMPSASLGWDATLTPRTYDITAARALMEAAGFDYADLGTPDANDKYSDSFFDITVLSPNTNPARNKWSIAYVEELPKIGIGVTDHVSTTWGPIIDRTFGYAGASADGNPGDYASDGFDILFVGYSWDLDWDPTGIYQASGLCGTGSCDNFMNFEDATVSGLVEDYLSELDFDKRLVIVKDLQQALFDSIPVIPILYPQSHWAWYDGITGIDPLLISVAVVEWDLVDIDPRPSDDGFIPISIVSVFLGISASALLAVIIRKKRS